jgi:NAD(P)-dependent dehydrogenase (short-subunit alcohol dehydrogenase family)
MGHGSKSVIPILGGVAAAAAGLRLVRRSSRFIQLRGKVVLITGGSRGLGLVLAREFAAKGALVAICARSAKELARVREEFSNSGKPLFAAVCDVGVRAEVGKLIESVQQELGEIDVLVNNAGTIVVGPAENQDTESFEDAMQTNFWGPHYAISAVLKHMKARRSGRIVNITSIGGKVAFPHLLPYTASKFALVGYSEGLRAELTKYKIYVTTVCPGLMRTGSPRNANFTGQPQKEYAWFAISDSLPLASIGPRAVARRIINACIHGDAEIHLGLTAKLGAVIQGCAPGTTAELLSVVNRFMPAALPGRPVRQKGAASESQITSALLTKLARQAELNNNQL